MHLKKLEIQGFKSFPEYTLIEFDKGMTAVVGPNGSGKSNVTDAIRWVLGEQSVKSLRGGKMEDVIFNGTSTRKAMNYAEVTLTLDNTDKFVDYDFPEIQITRRLYRSGESEYQINKVNCRLKDITGMFLDTGLGKDGYSIVGQGRVDEILSTKSEDRRRVIEEASGIVKFKVRKDEAERKLNSTEQNLVRIDDILNELSERLGPLEVQSQKAIKYHKAYEALKTKDISLLVHKISTANEAMGDSASVKESLEEEIKTQEDRFIKLRNDNAELSSKSDELEDKIEELRQELSDITEQEHELGGDKKVLLDRVKRVDEEVAQTNKDIEEYKNTIDTLTKQYQEKIDKADEILVKADDSRKAAENLEMDRVKIQEEFDSSEKDRSSIKSRIEGKTDELYDAKEKISRNIATITALTERIDSISNERKNSSSIIEELNKELEKADKLWHDMIKNESDVGDDINHREDKLKEVSKKQAELNKSYEVDNKEFLSGVAKLRTLKDIEKRKEGYQESVRRLMSEAETNSSVKNKIVGVLGDLISVPSKYETAIEIALGNAIHNIVTTTESDAAWLIDYLKSNRLGRVTFLPEENIKARDLTGDVLSKVRGIRGYIGIASDLVECDRELNDIISNLLGRIIITDTLENARNVAVKTDYKIKIISLDGDSVNPGGSLTGGSVRKNTAGILGRGREIEALQAKNDELEAKLADAEEKRQEYDDEIGTINREIAQLSEQLKYFSMERVKAESEYRNVESNLNDVKKRVKDNDDVIGQISKDKIRLEDDNEELTLIVAELEDELKDFKDDISKGDDEAREIANKINGIREKISENKTIAERLIAERNGVLQLAEHIKGEIDTTKEMVSSAEEEIKQKLEDKKENEKEIAEIDSQLSKFEASEKEYLDKIKATSEEKDKIDNELSGFVGNLTSISDTINNLRNKLSNHIAKYEKYINDIDYSKNRLWEEYEVTFDNVKDKCEPVTNVGELSKEISELKSEIKSIGPVNLNSIDEFKELSDRFEFMTSQRNDIYKAKTDLESVIAGLLEEMRTQFITHFDIINENFKRVFFDLFGGGTAEIMLENDDVLNCAIEIKAQPPGKKLQSLTLLSGGERCLTAIALLFAILELKPSPFVILDEVEAALDDVNVSRFTDFVRRYCVKSQFILVTHRKGTMEACDRMYGVTMQERGISKILSMRLS